MFHQSGRGYVSAILAIFLVISITVSVMPAHAHQAMLRLFALPVGQGDCTVIVCPKYNGRVVIVDMGSTSSGGWSARMVEQFLEQKIHGGNSLMSRIHAVIVTHSHKDHYNYIPEVLKDANAEVFLGGGDWNKANIGSDMHGWYEKRKHNVIKLNDGKACAGNDCRKANDKIKEKDLCGDDSVTFSLLAVNLGSTSNERSAVLKVELSQCSALLPGDFEGEKATKDLLDAAKKELHSTVYKISHHGASNKANHKDFLQAISPKVAFASSQHPDFGYHHPRCEVFQELSSMLGKVLKDRKNWLQHVECYRDQTHGAVDMDSDKAISTTAPLKGELCLLEFVLENNKVLACEHCGHDDKLLIGYCTGLGMKNDHSFYRSSCSKRPRSAENFP